MAKWRTVLIGITFASALLWLVGCSSARIEPRQTSNDQPISGPSVEPAPAPQPPRLETVVKSASYFHTVRRSGETLAVISLWYTGSVDNWKRLVEANNGLNPRRIRIGDEILIPEEFLKTHQPMPLGFTTPKTLPKSGSAPVKPAPYVHTVRRSGETLGAISFWYTGSVDNWKRLVEANNGLNPANVHLGDKILIPGELMKTHRPMPAGFMNPRVQAKEVTAARPPTPQTETGRIDLFGPIEHNDAVENPDAVGLPLESIE